MSLTKCITAKMKSDFDNSKDCINFIDKLRIINDKPNTLFRAT